jgi:hypothetical protein
MSRNLSITICLASVPVIVEFCPAASSAMPDSVVAMLTARDVSCPVARVHIANCSEIAGPANANIFRQKPAEAGGTATLRNTPCRLGRVTVGGVAPATAPSATNGGIVSWPR